jgi:hypothetical protein
MTATRKKAAEILAHWAARNNPVVALPGDYGK